MPVSQNGYSANDRSVIKTYDIAGELVPLRDDACGELLVEVALWIHANVESISKGHQRDDWGYAERPIRGGTTLSNHASGTALDFNATQHPLGVHGTWTRRQKRKVNRFLRSINGAVRWGENYSGRVDGMHFEINADYGDVRRALRSLRGDRTRSAPRWRRRDFVVNLANVRQAFKGGGRDFQLGVKAIQRELNRRGFDVQVDGFAGPATRAAYRKFEESIPGKVGNHDGVPGWFTLRVLGGALPLPQRRRFRVKRG